MIAKPFHNMRTWTWLSGLLLVIGALVLRLPLLGWGLPYVEHPDEPFYVEIVVRMVAGADPNPYRFWHPPLLFYLQSVATQVYGWVQINAGNLNALSDLPIKTYLYTVDPELYRWNRAVVALLGALTVLMLYRLGRQMFDGPTALLAGVSLLLARFHVEHSVYIATSAPTALFTTVALAAAWGVTNSGHWRSYLLLGAAAGLAAATKYNAGPIGLVVLIAHYFFWGRAGWLRQFPRVLAAGLSALVAFALTNPFAFLDWPRFLADVRTQSAAYEAGSGNFVGAWNLGGYLRFIWHEGLGPPGTLLLIAGLPLLIRQAPRQSALLLTAIGLEVALLLPYASHFTRNLLLIYPALLLLTAAAIVQLGRWLVTQLMRRWPQQAWHITSLLGVGLSLAWLSVPVRDTLWLHWYWSHPHTLVQAGEVLRAQPRGMLALVEANPVQWSGDPVVTAVPWLGANDAAWYRARGYRYLLLNREFYADDDLTFYERLAASGTPLLQLPERRLGQQPGPGGVLLDLGEAPERIPFIPNGARFGDTLALLGYELRPGPLRSRITPLEGANERSFRSGQPVQINLYWRVLAPVAHDYTLFLHLYTSDGQRVAQRDLPLRYEDYPSSHWRVGELVLDRADMPLPVLPPGRYTLLLGLYDATTGIPLPTADGAPLVLATLELE